MLLARRHAVILPLQRRSRRPLHFHFGSVASFSSLQLERLTPLRRLCVCVCVCMYVCT